MNRIWPYSRLSQSKFPNQEMVQIASFPFRENGEFVGFDIDIVKEVMARLCKKMELQDMSFSMLLPKLQSGTLHMAAARFSPSPEREGQLFFTRPYLKNIQAALTGIHNAPALRSILASLDSKKQALLLGHAFTMPIVIETRSYNIGQILQSK
jgi:ABC-type amino acid transport substrate-binding protein